MISPLRTGSELSAISFQHQTALPPPIEVISDRAAARHRGGDGRSERQLDQLGCRPWLKAES
jgi:hypothetical protein